MAVAGLGWRVSHHILAARRLTPLNPASPPRAPPQETLSTLAFLRRAKCVRNQPVVREDLCGDREAMQREIAR
jgi:hypothetical protein